MRLPLIIVASIVIVAALVLLFRTDGVNREGGGSEKQIDRPVSTPSPIHGLEQNFSDREKVNAQSEQADIPEDDIDDDEKESQEMGKEMEDKVNKIVADINSGKIKLDPNAPNPWKRPLGDSLYDHLCFVDSQRCYNDILMFFRKYADNAEGLSGVLRYLAHQDINGFVVKLDPEKRRILLDVVGSLLTHSSPEIRRGAGGLLARYFETPDDLRAVLRAMRDDADIGVRREMVSSAVEIFRERLSGKSSDWGRTYAEWMKNTRRSESSKENMENDIRSTLEAMRAREALAGENATEEIVSALAGMLERESDPDLRESVVETLGIYSGRSAVARDTLLQRYASLDEPLRWMAVNRLKTDDPKTFAFVREIALREADSGIGAIALDRMSWHLLKNEARSVFATLLSGDDEGKRHQALASLQRRSNDTPNDVWALKNAIEDSFAKERSERNRAIASELLKKINAMLDEDSK